MKSRKGFNSLSIHATATLSVALVLLLLGIMASLAIVARGVSSDIKEQMGFDVVLKETATADDVNQLKQMWLKAPYVASLRYYSPEEAMASWQAETGENLQEMLDVNPFSPEFEINVKADYATADSLNAIMLPLMENPLVEEVNGHTDHVERMNHTLRVAMVMFTLAAAALLLVSFVLINNTVRLTIYARRFTIHTMKLVGASPGFIMRPFLLSNAMQGIVAAILAGGCLALAVHGLHSLDPSLQSYLSWEQTAMVGGALLVGGVIICMLAAWLATRRYITRHYDDLFK
jgi:cell division transport system permease protein